MKKTKMRLIKRWVIFLLTVQIFMQCRHPDKKAAISSGEEMDGMEQAMHQEFMMTRDPRLNEIPSQRLMAAHSYMRSLLGAGVALRPMSVGWEERGPNNVGGRTRAIMIDKADATGNTVFAGSISGGLFKTTNFTSATPNWSAVNDFLPNLAITCLVQDNVNQNIMYAGTGEGWFNEDAIKGNGIYKSTDGGLSWNVLPSTIQTIPAVPMDSTFQFVQDIVIDNGGNIYAAIRNDIITPSRARGVKRSADGGATWTQVLGAPLTGFVTGRAADLEVAANGDVYASLGLAGPLVTNRSVVLKSSFATNGANTGALGTWTNITPLRTLITQRTEIALAPSDPQRVYLLMQDSATDQVIGIYRSFNGGASWDSVGSPNALNNGVAGSQTWYNLIAAVDPNNADILVVGGLGAAKSTDAGNTWTTITGGLHVDQHALVYHSSAQLLVGNDGGIFYSANANATSPIFTNKNNGYNVTQYYSCDFHPTNANYFLAGAQDNGTQKFTVAGINTTTTASAGDGGYCHINQKDGRIQITSNLFNRYNYSTNGGISFSFASTVFNSRGQFINPTDYDDNANTLYCGDDPGNYFFITDWDNTPSGNVTPVALMGTRELTAVKVEPSAANIIWIGASFGNSLPQILKLSSANSTSPTVVSSATLGSISNAAVSSIDVDPADANHILATLSNYGVVSVWESTNGGVSFSSIEGNLPDMPVHWGIFIPGNAQLNGPAGGEGGIMLASELGVWTTSQINGTSTQWIPNNTGLANVSTYMLRYRASDNLVAAATHGRGLFTTILPTVITGVPNNTITKDFIKYISAENNQLQIVIGTLSTRNMTIQLLDMNGRLVDSRYNTYQNSVIDLKRFQRGAYIVKITGEKKENFIKQFIRK